MKPVALIPTLCTLAGAFCGFLAISKGADAVGALARVEGRPTPANLADSHQLISVGCWLIFLAMVFDALDGRLARLADAASEFGATLDSLTDMLTFGAAPALLFKFLYETTRRLEEHHFRPKVVLLVTVLYVVCAALRLARFTAETEEDPESHDLFQGLPTPAAAGFLCSGLLLYVYLGSADGQQFLSSFSAAEDPTLLAIRLRSRFLGFLLLLTPALGLLMITKVHYVHLVNRYMRGRRPFTYVVQVVFLLFLLAIHPQWALFLGFLAYVFFCPLLAGAETLLGRRILPRSPAPDSGREP